MTTLSPQMAMTIDCDKLLSVPSGYLTPLPPTVNLHYVGKADYEDDTQDTPKEDPGHVANLMAIDLRAKLANLAEKQWSEEARRVQADRLKPSYADEFVKVPLPEQSSNPLAMLPPPAPHAVPRGETRKHRSSAIISKGSVGHPLNCAAACKYVKRKGGCRDGADCPNCHECFWSKSTAKDATESQRASSEAEPLVPVPGSQEALIEKVARLLQEESHVQAPAMAGWPLQAPDINMFGDFGTGGDYLGVKIPGTTDQGFESINGGVMSASMPCNPGSMGHPYSCGPACKYVLKPKGCKDGDLCTHCHICRWTRYAAKHQFKI